MKKIVLIMLAVVMISSTCWAVYVPVVPIVIVAGSGAAGMTAWGGLGIWFGTLAIFSPYFYQWYVVPECRQEKSLGEMGECLKKKGK